MRPAGAAGSGACRHAGQGEGEDDGRAGPGLRADRERAARNPAYKPHKRYITVIGSVTRFQLELEWETMPEHPIVWSEVVEGHGEFKDLVVAGMSECYVLKQLETEG